VKPKALPKSVWRSLRSERFKQRQEKPKTREITRLFNWCLGRSKYEPHVGGGMKQFADRAAQ
jgi:hypothetical protein